MHMTPSLDLKEFGICFGTKIVLADISLHLPKTGVTVLMGPVGTGKSSLLCSLAGIHSNNPRFKHWGEVYISGQPLDIGSQASTNHPVLVRQIIAQLTESVQNVILSTAKFSSVNNTVKQEFVKKLIVDSGIDELLPMLEQRLIDIKPIWQRIALILGAAATKPPLLMIDEPTNGLNHEETALMVRFIRQLGTQLKLIVVLHSQAQAREIADDMVLLAGGRVQFHGTTDAFFAKTPPNDIVKQFVQTGSVSVAAPDARKENLADDAIAPPPLPQAAIDAIKSFSHEAIHKEKTPKSSDVSPKPSTKQSLVQTHVKESATPEPKKNKTLDEQQKKPATSKPTPIQELIEPKPQAELSAAQLTPTKQLAELPKPSRNGVSIVAEIGKHDPSASRGPSGFSWIVPDMLAGCPMPGVSAPMSYDLGLLASVGITMLITLTEEDIYQAELKDAGLSNVHLPIYDREAPSLNQMHMLLFRMQKLIESGEVLAVHCLAGLGRTGTVLAAWMIKEGGLSSEEAIRRLRLINPGFVQSTVQETFLADFENDILRRMR